MGSSDFAGALAPGTKLLEYEIVRLLGRPGGFGMTYLAIDAHLGKTVAVKEYLPVDYAVRAEGNSVSLRSRQDQKAFDWGRSAFIKEARVLARFKHLNVVSVHRFFETNGTAYIVMEYVQGETLGERFARETHLEQKALLDILLPILDGLSHVHEQGVLHRDLKPDNIVITPSGTPVLIDFGAARNELGNRSRSAMNVFTAGYAPIEQYSDHDSQGAWTDIYALGAIAYRAIAGTKPADAISRMTGAYMPTACEVGARRYSEHLLDAVDWALEIKPENRPPDILTWRGHLLSGGTEGFTPSSEAITPEVAPGLDLDLSDSDDATRLAAFRDKALAGSSRAMAVPLSAELDETIQGYLAPERSEAGNIADRSPHPLRARRNAAHHARRESRYPDWLSTVIAWVRARPIPMAAGALVLLVVGMTMALMGNESEVAPGAAISGPAPIAMSIPAPAQPEPPLPTYPERSIETLSRYEKPAPQASVKPRAPPVGTGPKPEPAKAVSALEPERPAKERDTSTSVVSTDIAPIAEPAPSPAVETTTSPGLPVTDVAAFEQVSPPQPQTPSTMIEVLQGHLKGPWRAESKMSATLDGSPCKVEIERIWDLRFNGITSDKQHVDGKFLVESIVRSEAVDDCPAFRVKVNERGTFVSADERSDAVLLILHSFGCIGVDCERVRSLPMFRSGKTEAAVTFMVPPKYLRFARESEDLVFRNGS